MANAKISNDSIFDPKTNVRDIEGFAGYDSSGNAKISGPALVTSVINSNGSGAEGRVPFYGVGADNLGGSSGFTWNQSSDTLAIGTAGGAAGLNADLVLNGNYIAGNGQPELTFKFGDSTNTPSIFKITTQSTGSDQTWLLPTSLPTAGQILSAEPNGSEVTLDWVDDNTNTPNNNTITLAAGTGLTGGGDFTLNQNSNETITFNASGGGGGGFQTLTAGATVAWDASSGISASLTPTSTATPNTLSMTNFSAGDIGALKIIPTNTSAIILPSNSKAVGGNITLSDVNPSLLEFFYDGSTFYWWPEANMLDPIYIPNISKTNLISFYVPSTYEGSAGDVSTGAAWPNSYTSNNLIGDLTRSGTELDDIKFVARDDASSTPAHFIFGDDGQNTSNSHFTSGTFPAAFGADWSAGVWMQATANTATATYHGILDGDKDDQEAMYLDDRRFSLYDSGQNYSNFPALTSANGLQDVWVYYGVSISDTNDTCTFYIGCQETFDNKSGTIEGFDGNQININSDGLYEETISVTINEASWNDFSYGAAGSGGTFEFVGLLGMAAVYAADIPAATHIANWNATRPYYFIS